MADKTGRRGRGCFNPEALCKDPEGLGPAAADGHCITLWPLPKGTHILNVGASLLALQHAVTDTHGRAGSVHTEAWT